MRVNRSDAQNNKTYIYIVNEQLAINNEIEESEGDITEVCQKKGSETG